MNINSDYNKSLVEDSKHYCGGMGITNEILGRTEGKASIG